jgi:hypothetical protein
MYAYTCTTSYQVASTMIRALKDLSMYVVWLVEPLSNGIHTEVYMQTRGYANLRQLVCTYTYVRQYAGQLLTRWTRLSAQSVACTRSRLWRSHKVGDKLAAKVACGYKLHPTYVLHGYDGLNLTAILICCMLACRRELAVRIPTNPVQTSSSITYSG